MTDRDWTLETHVPTLHTVISINLNKDERMATFSILAKLSNICILEIVLQTITFIIVNILNVVGKLLKTRNYISRSNRR